MSLFTASPSDGVAWVTGASSGIGYALCLKLCAEGYDIVATARSRDKLEALASEAAGLSGKIIIKPADVTDADAMAKVVSEIETEFDGLALAVLNAGVYIPVHGDNLKLGDFKKTFDVNLNGIVHGLIPVAELMKNQGQGQIALVSSVTGYGGLPTSAAYGATKAAIINLAESLKFDFDKMNIRIQVINPGFVKTDATAQNEFEMPAIIPAEEAAIRMSEGLRDGKFEITFPKRFIYVLKLLKFLPYRAYFALVGKATNAR